MSTQIRILLVDDQAMVRSGLALILSAEPDLAVVAQLENGEGLIEAIEIHEPDIVLMDVRMPIVDGPTAIRELRASRSGPPVLVLTTFDDDDVLWSALRAGAAGFLLKDSPAEALVDAARAVASGGAWLDPRVLPRVLARARVDRPIESADTMGFGELTPREREVLALLCRGSNNAEISAQLHLAERTVKSHVSAILAKLGARDRAAAIVRAYDAGVAHLGW